MTRAAKHYALQVLGLMAVYTVLLVLSIRLLEQFPGGPWRIPAAVLPAVPLLFVVWSAVRFVSKMDEMQKSVHTEAVTFSFLTTAVVALTYGFLENAGLPRVSVLYVPVLMCFLWGIGAGIAHRKYR